MGTPIKSIVNGKIMQKESFILITFLLLLSACRGQNGQEFMAPEILSVEAEVNGATAVLRGTLSDSRVDRCGFSLSDGETTLLLDATLEDNVFSATAKGLVFNKTYRWEAFAMAGNNIIRSQEQVFTVIEGAIPIPDPAFKAYLLKLYDLNGDGELSPKEGERVYEIHLTTNQLGVKSLKGIEYMENLEELDASGDWNEGGIDPSNYPFYYLSHHYFWDNHRGPMGTLEELDVSHNPKLRVLKVGNNSALGDMQRSLDLSNNPNLEVLELHMTYLFYPEISHLKNLTRLNLSHLRGPLPDISQFQKLQFLDIGYEQTSNLRMFIDVSRCPDLEYLWIGGVADGVSDLSLNPKLSHLQIMNNGVRELDLSVLPLLSELNASFSYLRTVDVSHNPYLKDLRLSPMENDMLDTLFIAPGQVIPGVTENRSTEFIPERTKIVEKSPDNAIPIPDPAFKEYLIRQFDQDLDGNLSVAEARRIEKIDVITDRISSLEGIEYMPNLQSLYANGTSPGRGGLIELDLSSNPRIGEIQCFNNQIRSLNVSQNLVLEKLLCWENLLSELDVTHNTRLLELSCAQNLFTSLDVSNNAVLKEFHFNDTSIADIDLSANPKLENLSCWGTFLTQLDVSKNLRLSHLDCAPSPGNLLEVIYVASGQVIPGITVNRDSELIPENTRVEVKSVK